MKEEEEEEEEGMGKEVMGEGIMEEVTGDTGEGIMEEVVREGIIGEITEQEEGVIMIVGGVTEEIKT